MTFDFESQKRSIEVELSKDFPQTITDLKPDIPPDVKNDEMETPPVLEPVTVQQAVKPIPVERPQETVQENTKPLPPAIVSPKLEVTRLPKNPVKLPSSGVIFNSAYGKVHLYDLDDDFKARTGNENDFIFKEIKQPEWNIVTKLIDEEVDKPRIYMDFYSEGIVGSTERFFDKISYKKTFTTRYGTKIYCGGVGPLVMCSWK